VHGIKGTVKLAGGVVTMNPKLLKSGAKDFDKSVKSSLSGLAETAGGLAGVAMHTNPLGACVNRLTKGAASRLVEKTVEGTVNVVKDGYQGAKDVGSGLAQGDFKKAALGALKVGELGLMGAGVAASKVATTAGKELVKSGVTQQVTSAAGFG
jgi:hypothetical protein